MKGTESHNRQDSAEQLKTTRHATHRFTRSYIGMQKQHTHTHTPGQVSVIPTTPESHCGLNTPWAQVHCG